MLLSKKIIALGISLFLLVSCANMERRSEEAEIYSFLIERNPFGNIVGTPVIIVADAEYFEDLSALDDLDDPYLLSVTTINDYIEQGRKGGKLSVSLDIDQPYDVIKSAELKSLIREGDDWGNFNARYPDTHMYINFSKVGFNSDFTQALVYMSNNCGGECGEGNFYILIKKNGNWLIDHIIPLWIS